MMYDEHQRRHHTYSPVDSSTEIAPAKEATPQDGGLVWNSPVKLPRTWGKNNERAGIKKNEK